MRAREVQVNQSAAQLRSMELQVATDVTNAALQVQSGLTRYQAATVARSLAQQRLDAEQSRFDVGLSTNFFVVQAQRDLATAQNTEFRALLDYRKALVDYERLQETPSTRGAGITTINAGRRWRGQLIDCWFVVRIVLTGHAFIAGGQRFIDEKNRHHCRLGRGRACGSRVLLRHVQPG